ncbi:hypothetical protein EJB05_38242, partial [Eragrostis curvula]
MSDAGEAGGGGRGRAQRLPRWTRQEILVLIEGKRVVERSGRGRGRGRGRGGGEAGVGGTAAAAEPTKWAAVAEYCRRHGVDRGPVQCRKRWSNLAGDYKKIRERERAAGKGEASFWAMRNDARKERRLPGFFDREVYDILEGRGAGAGGCRGTAGNAAAARLDLEDVEGKQQREKKPVVLDSGGARAGGGLFSSSTEDDDDDDDGDEAATPPTMPSPALAPTPVAVPISEKKTDVPRQESHEQGISKRKERDELTEQAQGRQKRQHSVDEASERSTTDLQGQLIQILDRSGRIMAAQLEAQNINSQLDREQRKEQASTLLGVLGKVADALYRIADKL